MRKHRLYGFSLAMLTAGGVGVSQWPSVSQDIAGASSGHHKAALAANNKKKTISERADYKKAQQLRQFYADVTNEQEFLFLTAVHSEQVWLFVTALQNQQNWLNAVAQQQAAEQQFYEASVYASGVEASQQQYYDAAVYASGVEASQQQYYDAAVYASGVEQAAAQQQYYRAAVYASGLEHPAAPAPAPVTTASSSSGGGSAPSGILSCIANAESTGNPSAVNSSSGAGGLYQFLPSSWAAYGGTQYAPVAQDATVAQQTAVAQTALAESGTSPWAGDSCIG
jgi:hypothetical protein